MSELARTLLRLAVLRSAERLMATALLDFADLVALLLASGGLDRAQLERALAQAERTLARDGLGRTPIARELIPLLRACADQVEPERAARDERSTQIQ